MGSWRCRVSERNHRWFTLVIVLVLLLGLCVLGKHSRKKGSGTEHSRGHSRRGPEREREVEYTNGHSRRGPEREREVEHTNGHSRRGPERVRELEHSREHSRGGLDREREVEHSRGHSRWGPEREREVEHTRERSRGGPRREKGEQTRGKPRGGPGREEEARIAGIRDHLLQQLGITELPTNPEEYVEEVSEEIIEEYHILVEAQSRELLSHSALEAEQETLGAQKVSSFRGDIVEVHSRGDWLPGKGLLRRHYRLAFDFSIPPAQTLTTIQLVLHQHPVSEGQHQQWVGVQQTVEIEKVVSVNDGILKTPLGTKMLTFGHGGFRLLDLTLDSGSWLRDGIQPDGEGHVELEATVYFAGYIIEDEEEVQYTKDLQWMPPSITFDSGAQDPSRAPRLVLMTTPQSAVKKKMKRSTKEMLTVEDLMSKKYCSPDTVYCCLHNITINFARDLYWTFVVEPKEAVFGFCSGPCPTSGGSRLETPDVYRTISSVMPSVKPCCTGKTYHPFSIMTTWRSFPIITFQSARVVDCYCR